MFDFASEYFFFISAISFSILLSIAASIACLCVVCVCVYVLHHTTDLQLINRVFGILLLQKIS